MELRLTIFFALTFIVLSFNAVVLWWMRRALHRTCERARKNRAARAQLEHAVRLSVRTAVEVTNRLALVSGEIRAGVHQLDSGLGRLDNWARYGLAKVDFNADRVSARMGARARDATSELQSPLFKTATVIHGVRTILDLAVRWKTSKTGRLVGATRVLGPIDTAVTVVQALTALGGRFSGRNGSSSR